MSNLSVAQTKTRIILDNAGGVTLQLGDWAHYYNDASKQVADDIREWCETRDTAQWEGHEDDAAELNPTAEQYRNGGYREVIIHPGDSARDVRKSLYDLDWGNAQALAEAL
jgi:hypothetical protein